MKIKVLKREQRIEFFSVYFTTLSISDYGMLTVGLVNNEIERMVTDR